MGETYLGIGNCILGYVAKNSAPAPRKANYMITVTLSNVAQMVELNNNIQRHRAARKCSG
ncbi:MAG: hypothetical protein V8S92_09210 [Oscillospiraceae bacterium]